MLFATCMRWLLLSRRIQHFWWAKNVLEFQIIKQAVCCMFCRMVSEFRLNGILCILSVILEQLSRLLSWQEVEVLSLVCTRGQNVWPLYNLSDVSCKNRYHVSNNGKQKIRVKKLSQEWSDVWQLISDVFCKNKHCVSDYWHCKGMIKRNTKKRRKWCVAQCKCQRMVKLSLTVKITLL